MNIGIIIHSVTGNTLTVALKIQKALEESGHTAEIKEIKTEGKVSPGEKTAVFSELPSFDGFDSLIFGSHTEAFQLEQAMKLYFQQVDGLSDKKVACVVTHQFPFAWLGGNNAVKKMQSMCEEKGAKVLGTAVVDWSPEKKRETNISAAIDYICSLF